MTEHEGTSQHVTHGEFITFAKRTDTQIQEIRTDVQSLGSEFRGAIKDLANSLYGKIESTRPTGSMLISLVSVLLVFLGMGAGLIWFSIAASTQPILQTLQYMAETDRQARQEQAEIMRQSAANTIENARREWIYETASDLMRQSALRSFEHQPPEPAGIPR